MTTKNGGPAFPISDFRCLNQIGQDAATGTHDTSTRDRLYAEAMARAAGGMSLRDAMAMSVRLPDDFSEKWGEALIGEEHPLYVESVSVHIDWWMRVEAAYRYRMADAMLKAREVSND